MECENGNDPLVMRMTSSMPRGAAAALTTVDTSSSLRVSTSTSSTRTRTSSGADKAQVKGGGMDLDLEKDLPDVTVKVFLEQMCQRLCDDITQHATRKRDELLREFHIEKQQLLEDAEADRQQAANGKRVKPMGKTITISYTEPNKPEKTVNLNIGPTKRQCDMAKVGRGRSAALQPPTGISLWWDDEVSTTHGKFLVMDDGTGVGFVDARSTNGSKVLRNNVTHVVEDEKPFLLQVGDVLCLGATTLTLTAVQ